MNYLTVDEIETLCKGSIKGKDKLYTNLTIECIRSYLNNTIEPNIANGDADKKEKFKTIKEICNKAINLLSNGTEAKDLISAKDISMLEDQIRMKYMLDPRTVQEKAEEALKDKNRPYRYFFTEDDIVGILTSSGSGSDIIVEKIPEELISSVEKIFTAKNQSYKALIKKLSPMPGTKAKDMSDYSAFSTAFDRILKENSEGRRDVERDVSDDAALELNSTVVPQIEKYYNGCTDKATSWKAVSYLLMFPEIIGMLSNARKIEDNQADGMIELVRQNFKLRNANEAKDIIKTLAPHFDVEIPISKFENTSGNGGGYNNDGYSSADGSARLQLTRYIKQLEGCLSEKTVLIETLKEAIDEIDIWESTFPDEPYIEDYRSLINEGKEKITKANSMIDAFYQMYKDMQFVTNSASEAANDLRRIKNGARVPITERQNVRESYNKLHELTLQLWGDVTVKDSKTDVMNKLGSLKNLLNTAVMLKNEYSGEVIDAVYNMADELFSHWDDVCYFNSNYTNLGLPVPKKVIVIAAILILVIFPFGWILLLSLAIFYVVNEIGKKKQWDKNTIITRSVIIAVSVCAVILSVGLIKDIRKKLANKQNNKAETTAITKNTPEGESEEAAKEEHKDYVMLTDLSEPVSLSYYDEVKDNLGNTYFNGIGGVSSDEINAQEYSLNKEYARLTGRVVLNYDSMTDIRDDVCLWIYGDGNKLYKSEEITAGCLPQDIDIDISGISRLRIEVSGKNMIRLVDCCLYNNMNTEIVSTAEYNMHNFGDTCKLYTMDCYNRSFDKFVYYEMAKDYQDNNYPYAIGGESGWSTTWQEYFIDKYYSRMEGKVVLSYERKDSPYEAVMRIYGDGELLFESEPLTSDPGPQEFSIDISDISVLRVEIDDRECIRLVDTRLFK